MLRDRMWRQKIFWAGLLLLVPVIGWPSVLGYRKDLIGRLFSGAEPLLPALRGRIPRHLAEGLKAVAVIFSYYAPLYLALLLLLSTKDVTPGASWLLPIGLCLLFPLFSPLSFPAATLYWTLIGEPPLGWGTGAVLLMLFALVTFLIPAAFLQVSVSGSYWSAFRVFEAVSLIRTRFNAYVRAWIDSICLSLFGHFAFPFSPWGVVWSYLGIIFAFNSTLVQGAKDPRISFRGSWFEKLLGAEAIVLSGREGSPIHRWRRAGQAFDAGADVLHLGLICVPLPRLIGRALRTEQ